MIMQVLLKPTCCCTKPSIKIPRRPSSPCA
jgi:hypothetical protein